MDMNKMKRALQMASDGLEPALADDHEHVEPGSQLAAQIEAHRAVNEALREHADTRDCVGRFAAVIDDHDCGYDALLNAAIAIQRRVPRCHAGSAPRVVGRGHVAASGILADSRRSSTRGAEKRCPRYSR